MEILSDPLKDRVMKNLISPPHKCLLKSLIFPDVLMGDK